MMTLRKCSAKAMSLCPDAKICCTQRHPGEFAEGSECHKFNEEVESQFTNADRIRSMSDEELCDFILEKRENGHCFNDRCYVNDPNKGCDDCTMEWLKQPYKENEE